MCWEIASLAVDELSLSASDLGASSHLVVSS